MPVSWVSSRSRRSCSSIELNSQARHAFCSSASSQRGPSAGTALCDEGDTCVLMRPGYWRNSQALNYAVDEQKVQSSTTSEAPPMTSTLATQIPGYVAGTWDIDASHSTVGFSVRHMMVSKARGYFREFSGQLVTAEDPTQSTVTATIDLGSIDTRQEQRDAHIRSADFFDAENHPHMTFTSTGVRGGDGADRFIDGELTIKGNTKPVVLELELNGFGPDAYGGFRAGFSAKTEISRKAFGVDIDMPMDGGGVVVSDKINVELEIEAVLRTA